MGRRPGGAKKRTQRRRGPLEVEEKDPEETRTRRREGKGP